MISSTTSTSLSNDQETGSSNPTAQVESKDNTKEEMEQMKGQLLCLQQQHTKLYENVQQLHRQQFEQHVVHGSILGL